MTDMRHDTFAQLAAAYALGALDAAERADFEVHLRTCDACQQDVAVYRGIGAGIGSGVEPVAPPAAVKTRVLAAATASAQTPALDRRTMFPTPPAPRPAAAFPWLALAASLVLAAAAGAYAWILHQQLATSRRVAVELSTRAETMRGQLGVARADAARSTRVLEVLAAPDVVPVSLAGTKAAASASGHAYWSPSHGVWLTADGLPALSPGRIYQVWLVLPKQAPISGGLLTVNPRGAGTLLSTGPAAPGTTNTGGATLAITNEPAAGSPGPTTPILLAGTAKTE
jgi:anti-sigma-K factor RskA